MTGLLRLLGAILGRHIEGDEVVVLPAPPRLPPLSDDEIARHLRDGVEPWRVDERNLDGGWYGGEWPRLWPPRQPVVRPCWCCGNQAGFHVEHRPCWNVPHWKPNATPEPWARMP